MNHICCIAAHDTSNGAGITRDCIVANDFGVWAHPVVTALTAQSFQHVESIFPVKPEIINQQLCSILANFPVSAIKIGMLYQKKAIETVVALLNKYFFEHIVVDPIMFSSGNESLLSADAYDVLYNKLLPCATLITPNKSELEAIGQKMIRNINDAIEVARGLALKFNAAVLVKGGHFDGMDLTDYLLKGESTFRVNHKRRNYTYSHGSGCVLSTALTCCLALGYNEDKSLGQAVDYTLRYFDAVNVSFV